MQKSFIATFTAAVILTCGYTATAARAEVLITPDEAKLPSASGATPSGAIALRGLTRGPAIEQVSPDPRSNGIKSPLPLSIRFIAHNNTTVVLDSVKVTYLKSQTVDLTSRIKPHLTGTGIEISDAEVPPGRHILRIELQDSQGRAGTGIIKLSVAP